VQALGGANAPHAFDATHGVEAVVVDANGNRVAHVPCTCKFYSAEPAQLERHLVLLTIDPLALQRGPIGVIEFGRHGLAQVDPHVDPGDVWVGQCAAAGEQRDQPCAAEPAVSGHGCGCKSGEPPVWHDRARDTTAAMHLPNLLASRRGRLTAFFFLYVTEGIPLGFGAYAVATQLRRQGVGPAEIGAFVGSFYLPWAFKWAFGPFIDVFASDRFGRRRGWIIVTQVLMALTLMSTARLELPQQLGVFTLILLVHNSFGAMQDVAIDALAVNTLDERERGLANGLMFAGAALGQAVGGSGVLFLSGVTGFQSTFFFVAGSILAVTLFVALPMREAPSPRQHAAGPSRWQIALKEMRGFAVESFRSFLGTRGAFLGLAFAVLPSGAMCLGLALQSNLAVELGLSDDQFALLTLWTSVIQAVFMVLGGYLSDRFGRRRTSRR
jgi:MFS family permease